MKAYKFDLRLTVVYDGAVTMVTMRLLLILCLIQTRHSFLTTSRVFAETVASTRRAAPPASLLAMSSSLSSTTDAVRSYSWSDLQRQVGGTVVGMALNAEVELRSQGKGSAHVQNKLRQFGSEDEPKITLFRDHAGWCV